MPRYTVSRSVEIEAPPEQILPLIVSFREWRRWSPFEDVDPQLTREYRGTDGEVGAEYEWSGNRRAGAGVMRLAGVAPEQVEVQVRFLRPFKSSSEHSFDVAVTATGASVVWTMRWEQTGLMGLFGRLVPMVKVMGETFDKGLASLKREAEANRSTTLGNTDED